MVTKNETFLTQAELAQRWRCSQQTIIRRREQGHISCFRSNASCSPLYPIEDILRIEQEKTQNRKEVSKLKKKPVKSANKEWRV